MSNSSRRSLLRLAIELAVGIILVGGLITLIMSLGEKKRLTRELAAARDSLAVCTSYDYAGLLTELLDLETELNARQTHSIPSEVGPIKLPPADGSASILGARPVPSFATERASPDEQARAATQLNGAHVSQPVRVVYHQSDVQTSGAAARLTALGFMVTETMGDRPGRVSTALTIGDQVSEADARLAALALISSGVDLKRIRHSSSRQLSGTIEIRYVKSLLDWPRLTVAGVLSAAPSR